MSASAGLLVANRGEVAIRVLRAARALGLRTCAVRSEDDAASLHLRHADAVHALRGRGPAAYLDAEQLVQAARDAGCTLVHPGYGFLSEDASFARACAKAGLTFVGPAPETLELFGDKAAARRLARERGVPVPAGTEGPTTLEQAQAFLASLGDGAAVMLKALAGGGGRGMRLVEDPAQLPDAYARCRSEARGAFGRDDVYVEQVVRRARHVEVQMLGDGETVVALGDRDCTLQRNRQKLIEIAPAPGLGDALRARIAAAAVALATAARLRGLCTVELLVSGDAFVFIEANPRLQVEHTVTEEVSGLDLVAAQLRIARGATLAELGLRAETVPPPRGFAVEARVSMETLLADGGVRPAGGVLTAYDPPSGPGVRVDGCGYAGYRTNPAFDTLIAKVIGHAGTPRLADALERTYEALGEFRIEGPPANLGLLQALLRRPELRDGTADTGFVEAHLAELLAEAGDDRHPRRFYPAEAAAAEGAAPAPGAQADRVEDADGATVVATPLQGTVVALRVAAGEAVGERTPVVVVESMKMEHEVLALVAGTVRRVLVAVGDVVYADAPLALVDAGAVAEDVEEAEEAVDLERIRPDLAAVRERQARTLDAARPAAVERRHASGRRTARENVADLCDPGSFREYGALAVAAMRARRPLEQLIETTPADGLVAGIGRVNGAQFGDADAHCAVLAYDYTVLAGSQGRQSHRKTDRLIALAERLRLPVVLFAEGGGGRPGETDMTTPFGLENMTFAGFAGLSGVVPRIGIAAGYTFAGNAALLGCCDLIVATPQAAIGMGGPAMVEGGGLGSFRPDEIGPLDVQARNGVVDLVAADEAEAVREAKRLLACFQGPLASWEAADQRLLRAVVPERRTRAYDVRRAIELLADGGSAIELRRDFAPGMVTAFARVEGRPLGIVANNAAHLGGAITAEGADKAARFLRLCDAHGLPIVFLCDTPGMMVGPEVERTALVRHCSRLFLAGASLSVPFGTIVLRKGYGLGANAMTAGSFHAPLFTVAWPTGEFGGMNPEGEVRLGHRRELAAIEDPAARAAAFERMVAEVYEHGSALSMASYFEIDDVIDPAASRAVISGALRAAARQPRRAGERPPFVDAW